MKNGNPKSADFFLLNILWKNKFFLLTVTVVCTVGAWFISRSSLFQPRYECTAYVCAENSTPMPQMLFNTEDVRFELILKYGTIEPRLLDHFTMLTSYNFNSRVQCHEQRGGNTLISASDENPQKAFQMVETIIEVIQQKGLRFGQDIKVITPPKVATQPVRLNSAKTTFFVGVLSFVFCAISIILIDFLLQYSRKKRS